MPPDIKILVATHKPYEFPDGKEYLPVQVGAALSQERLPIEADDQGENISRKNKNYCELTALYWAWKNLDADYLGLVHYRRHFRSDSPSSAHKLRGKKIVTGESLVKIFSDQGFDIILPNKRNYFIESIESHYRNAHFQEDLDLLKNIIGEHYPQFSPALKQVLSASSASMFNMFVAPKSLADDYCLWLFDVLEKTEAQLILDGRSEFQQRVFGFLAEILLNVWVLQKGLKVCYLSVVHLEGENLLIKGRDLILRKILADKKYDS